MTFTSTMDPILNRTVPVVLSILFGKSSKHYEHHFLAVFDSLPVTSFSEFDSNWPGMICDFSDAERIGFEQAFYHFLKVRYGITNTESISTGSFYTFCDIHFKRSVARVKQDASIVPTAVAPMFYQDALNLRSVETISEFAIAVMNFKTKYPKATRWIDWYLNLPRARILFNACKGKIRH